MFVCLFELMLNVPGNILWSCRDIASISLDFYPELGRHDSQKVPRILPPN